MHQLVIGGPTESVDILINYCNILLFFSVYFSAPQEQMCHYDGIDISIMSLWHVPDSPECHLSNEYH